MCIVCNCDDIGLEFLNNFEEAKQKMANTAISILQCSKTSKDWIARERYDKIYKKMVRLVKDWNRLEHEREAGIK